MVVDHTRDLSALARRLTDDADPISVLGHALEALRDVVPYDLAAVLRLTDGQLRVAAAKGRLADGRVLDHSIPLSRFPSIQRVLEQRQPVPMEEHHHASEEGDPYDGVLDFPHGHSCMVIPLAARDQTLGVITLDRDVCQRYDDHAVRVAGLYGQLVSLALWLADTQALLQKDRWALEERNRLLRQEVQGATSCATLLEDSDHPEMQDLVRQAKQAAPSRLPILILGETGTGKEVVSQAIHAWSDRSDGPFVKMNCSAIPEGLIESELFGHKKGAFSGAERDRPGRFVTANGGTLLLDEIGDMPLSAQAKLLRVLQEGTFEPVGADEPSKVDVRVLAATHVDLEAAVEAGRFRKDLWYRLAVFPIRLPALRDRPDDAVRIAERFLRRQAKQRPQGPWTLSEGAKAAIRRAPWPGNVRELINVLERATVLQPEGELSESRLGLSAVAKPASVTAVAEVQDQFPTFADQERDYLSRALARADGKLYGDDGAAALVGLKPSTLRSKLLKHGLR